MTRAYYNEIDPFAAEWLRNLIAAGHIAPGDVDTRSVEDVLPEDLHGYTQCHFFAGIGGWSLALRLAGWPDDRPVWTGSCPCQPFSAAGKGRGTADERHLWPAWGYLIEQCRPRVVFGEQVEAAVKHGWLDLVQADLEGLGYALGAVGLPAASVGAPHIRSRLWFVADAYGGNASTERQQRGGEQRLVTPNRGAGLVAESNSGVRWQGGITRSGETDGGRAYGGLAGSSAAGLVADRHPPGRGLERGAELLDGQRPTLRDDAHGRGADGLVADSNGAGSLPGALPGLHRGEEGAGPRHGEPERRGATGNVGLVADREREGLEGHAGHGDDSDEPGRFDADQARPVAAGSWTRVEWLPCRDGKARPTEPGLFPLAHGVPGRVGRLRAYGNAIVPQVAAEVISAFMESSNV